jgi:pimeloyl-ACP methyl ester carboxylesterase
VEIWIDSRNRLARVVLSTSHTVAVRDDIAAVLAREERLRHPRDQDVFIGLTGFNLGATITPPVIPVARAPAIILTAHPGPQDRDYTAYGVPVFAQLAGALSNAGYFVVRYDARGVGRSGGRTENASLTEYAEDLTGVVDWLRKRRDVDSRRIAALGFGDGGPVALLAASRDEDIRALALLAAPGRSGREVTLEQQERLLASLAVPDADRTEKIALQRRIIDATLTGKGWESIPADLRRQADTDWFKSWLQFDPAAAFRRMKQPVLVLHAALDAETPPEHSAQLEALSRARKVPPTHTRVQVLAGLNHLFVPSRTGLVSEYSTLADLRIPAEVPAAVVAWLSDALPPH